MNGELRMENEELKTPGASMRSVLLDVAAAANDALYTSYATPEDAAKAYAEALDLIRKSVRPPDTFFTPVGLLPALPAPSPLGKPDKTFVKLPLLWAGKIKLPLTGGEHSHTLGAWLRTNREGMEEFEIWKDEERVAHGEIFLGHDTSIQMVKGMLHRLQSRSGKNARHRFNARARAAADKAAAAPIDPPLAVPPRPGLPEDDE